MNRSNPIEFQLLSRCHKFDSDDKINQILESRYSSSGHQKNYLILLSTKGDKNVQPKMKRKSLLHHLHSPTSTNKYDSKTTRNEFKKFVRTNLDLQKKLARSKKDVVVHPDYDKVLKFEHFIPLNALWTSYMDEVVSLSENKSLAVVLNKLSSSDMIGAFIRVCSSKNFNLVGLCGIVVWESQFHFIIVVPTKDGWKSDFPHQQEFEWSKKEQVGGIRMITKQNTNFAFTLPMNGNQEVEFVILGNRFQCKPTERGSRKFKNHNVKDL